MIQFDLETRSVVSLPWYDLPEVGHATDALWHELAEQFRHAGIQNVPSRLNRDVAYEQQWTSPDFLFGQACGYDVRVSHADRLQVVATPCYNAPDCEGSKYSSYVVVHDASRFEALEDLRGTRCVINTPTSHSGMNVLRALVAPLHSDGRFFAEVHVSGSHERSLRMIQQGQVDVAAIDCVTYALLVKHRPSELVGSRILYRTERAPAPPYVTAASTRPDTLARMREALIRTLALPSLAAVKDVLLLAEVEVLPDEAYGPIASLESIAQTYNYCEFPLTR